MVAKPENLIHQPILIKFLVKSYLYTPFDIKHIKKLENPIEIVFHIMKHIMKKGKYKNALKLLF